MSIPAHPVLCSAVFDQNIMTPMSHPPYSPDLVPSDFFLFPWMKKSSKGNVLLMWKRRNKKKAEVLKGIKIDEFKNFLSSGKKVSISVLRQRVF